MTTTAKPGTQDITAAMTAIEEHRFEPVAVIRCARREGHLPNGTCVGFRWIDMNYDEGPYETWSIWRWAIQDGKARLFSGRYDMRDRQAAIEHATYMAKH